MPMNMFEFATRSKLRFTSARGELTAEQLWDVPLRSRDDFSLLRKRPRRSARIIRSRRRSC